MHARHQHVRDGRGTGAPGGAGAGPRARSRARRRSARAPRRGPRRRRAPGARRFRIGPTSPRLRRSPSIASATPGCWTLTATGVAVVRARAMDLAERGERERLLVEVGEQLARRARRARCSTTRRTRLERDRRRAARQRAEGAAGALALDSEHREELHELRPPRPSSARAAVSIRARACVVAAATSPAQRPAPSPRAWPPLAQQLSPAAGIDPRWLGGVDEVAQHAHEAQRVVEVREVAGVGEDLEPAARRPAACAARACSTGMIGSRSPQTIRNGIDSAR